MALAAFAAAGLSGGNPMKTGLISVKLALAGFIVPYMFVYSQQLMLTDVTFLTGIQVTITACIGVLLLALAAEGYMFTKANFVVRIVAFVAALLLISSTLLTDVIGLAAFAAIFALQKVKGNKVAKAGGGASFG